MSKKNFKYLVGDIGNTSTKISLLNKNFNILRSFNIDSKKLFKSRNIELIFQKIPLKNINNKILFSSVVPKIYKNLKKYLRNKGLRAYEVKELKINKIIKLNVDSFKQVGSDRVVNAIGSYNAYKTTRLR